MLLLSPGCDLGTSENSTLHFLLQGIFWSLSLNQNLPGSFVAFHFFPPHKLPHKDLQGACICFINHLSSPFSAGAKYKGIQEKAIL